MRTIALHGDYATPEMLKRDMGDPTWVDEYFDGRGWRYYGKSLDKLIQLVNQPTILVGYSRGCAAICDIANTPLVSHWIEAAVIYEGPVTDSNCGGDFPVLQVWNNRGALKRLGRIDDCIQSMQCWSATHQTTLMIGSGMHMRLKPPGHDWDRSLNNCIEDWINKQIGRMSLTEAMAPPL